MTSDPDDGSIERVESPANRAVPHQPEALAELLRAAASPDLSRALAGEDAAVNAFRAARIDQQHPPAARRDRVVLHATIAASVVALLETTLASAATTNATPTHELGFAPGSSLRATTEPSLRPAVPPTV
jgi:hypothetical protein